MSEPSKGKSKKGLATALAVVLVIVFLVVGLGGGYLIGSGKTTTNTTTSTATSVSTVVSTAVSTVVSTATVAPTNPDLGVNFWANSFNWNYSWGGVTREQVVGLLNAKNSSIFILDNREPADYANAHIPSAINIPFQNISAAIAAGEIPKNDIIITVCYVGDSAGVTAGALRGLGYNAFDLWAGAAGWNNASAYYGPDYAMFAVGVNYPIATGSAPGTWTYWAIPSS
jgi:rhodanese-related sulfurtransferase